MTGRRVLAPFVSVLLLAASAAPALAGGRPETGPLPGGDTLGIVEFDAGDLCDFAVTWEFLPTHPRLITFPVPASGDQTVRQVGHFVTRVINADTDASITLNTSGRQDFVYHEDGSVDVFVSGRVVGGYFPTDVGGPASFLFVGRLHDTLDGSFTALAHESTGRATDLCAALE